MKESRSDKYPVELEKPSDRAALVIILRNEATGEQVIWHRADEDEQRSDHGWLHDLLTWGTRTDQTSGEAKGNSS